VVQLRRQPALLADQRRTLRFHRDGGVLAGDQRCSRVFGDQGADVGKAEGKINQSVFCVCIHYWQFAA